MIVWKWKANVDDFLVNPNAVAIFANGLGKTDTGKEDFSLFGRDGWVAFEE